MNNMMHEHLNKLRIISTIREGQKLNTSHGQLSVYEPGVINWFYRKWNNDSKDEGTNCLRTFYTNLDQAVEQHLNEIKNCEARENHKKKRLLYVASTIAEKIKLSIAGIEKLSKTYVEYPKTTSELEGIVQDIAIVTYKQLIENLPGEYITDKLKERITYNGTTLYKGIGSPSSVSSNAVSAVSASMSPLNLASNTISVTDQDF